MLIPGGDPRQRVEMKHARWMPTCQLLHELDSEGEVEPFVRGNASILE